MMADNGEDLVLEQLRRLRAHQQCEMQLTFDTHSVSLVGVKRRLDLVEKEPAE